MQQTFKAGRSGGKLVAGLVALIAVGALLFFAVPLLQAVRPAAPVDWPTTGWQTTTPEAQGIDSDKPAEALPAMREKHGGSARLAGEAQTP